MNLLKGILFFNMIFILNGFQNPQNYMNYLEKRSLEIIKGRKENLNNTLIPKLLFLDKNNFLEEEKNKFSMEIPNYNFSHIGGYTEIKKELYQMKDIIDNIEKYKEYNIRIPKGTGKAISH